MSPAARRNYSLPFNLPVPYGNSFEEALLTERRSLAACATRIGTSFAKQPRTLYTRNSPVKQSSSPSVIPIVSFGVKTVTTLNFFELKKRGKNWMVCCQKRRKKKRKEEERNAALVAIKFDAQGPESRPIKIEERMQTIELMHLHLLNISIPSDYRDADRKKKGKKEET